MKTAGVTMCSLAHYWRTALGIAAAAALAATVLLGALAIGRAARDILRSQALLRIGRADLALQAADRFFESRLADDLELALRARAAPALLLAGTVARPDRSAQTPQARVLGVDARFWSLSSAGGPPAGFTTGAVVNAALAQHLGVRLGEELIVRLPAWQAMPPELGFSFSHSPARALRVTVQAIADDLHFGRFNVLSEAEPPQLVFLPLAALQRTLEQEQGANLILLAAGAGRRLSLADAAAGLRRVLTLVDLQLEFVAPSNAPGCDLKTRRVFLEPPIVAAARALDGNATEFLAYFMNAVESGTNTAPYLMAAAVPPPMLPCPLPADGIALTRWLADDLQVATGQSVTARFFVPGADRRLRENSATFRVTGIVPMDHPLVSMELVPDFPGLAAVASCRDWQPELPIDLTRIRPLDEAYWEQYRAAPKAFIAFAQGQALWSNVFGNATSIRFSETAGTSSALAALLSRQLDPSQLGFAFQPVRETALASAAQSQDFSQLFLGLGIFIALAAIILLALFWGLHLARRAAEIGTFLALGYTRGQARRIYLLEGLILTLAGALAGIPLALAYARWLFGHLAPLLRAASAPGIAILRPSVLDLLATGGVVIGVALVAILLVLRSLMRYPVPRLLANDREEPDQPAQVRRLTIAAGAGLLLILSALILAAFNWNMGRSAAGLFFLCGALCLAGLLLLGFSALRRLGRRGDPGRLTLLGLGARGAGRHPWRSLAAAGLMACGTFLIAAVAVNEAPVSDDAHDRSGATGGFALLGQSTTPLRLDLNRPEARRQAGLDDPSLQAVHFLACRLREGDDASCLTPSRAQTLRILGVPADALAARQAFNWTRVAPGMRRDAVWSSLQVRRADGAIPAAADETTIAWGLGKKVGDTLLVRGDNGREYRLILAAAMPNSALQGHVLIAADRFLELFPGDRGPRFFLIEAPRAVNLDALCRRLNRQLFDFGFTATPALTRLHQLHSVEATYIALFRSLGALGLLFGACGLGILLLRNALERRGELALLQAVGFQPRHVAALLFGEHALLLGYGLASGLLAGLLAAVPALHEQLTALPLGPMFGAVGLIALCGFTAIGLAALLAARTPPLAALREE
jgi:ABC-type lipoprotein release transport system permease subunit